MSTSRQLKIDDDIIGAFDDRKDWTADFGVVGPNDVSKDEEIARRLQMAEENTETQHNINKMDVMPDWKAQDDKIQRHHAEAQRRNAEIKRNEEENKRRFAERALENEKRERQTEREQEYIRKMNNFNRLSAERASLRTYYPSTVYSPVVYDRLYNWSLTLLPDYYDYVKRQQLRDALSTLIKRELRSNIPESELEENIKRLIREERPKSKARPKSKSRPRSKARPKSKGRSKSKSRPKSKK